MKQFGQEMEFTEEQRNQPHDQQMEFLENIYKNRPVFIQDEEEEEEKELICDGLDIRKILKTQEKQRQQEERILEDTQKNIKSQYINGVYCVLFYGPKETEPLSKARDHIKNKPELFIFQRETEKGRMFCVADKQDYSQIFSKDRNITDMFFDGQCHLFFDIDVANKEIIKEIQQDKQFYIQQAIQELWLTFQLDDYQKYFYIFDSSREGKLSYHVHFPRTKILKRQSYDQQNKIYTGIEEVRKKVDNMQKHFENLGKTHLLAYVDKAVYAKKSQQFRGFNQSKLNKNNVKRYLDYRDIPDGLDYYSLNPVHDKDQIPEDIFFQNQVYGTVQQQLQEDADQLNLNMRKPTLLKVLLVNDTDFKPGLINNKEHILYLKDKSDQKKYDTIQLSSKDRQYMFDQIVEILGNQDLMSQYRIDQNNCQIRLIPRSREQDTYCFLCEEIHHTGNTVQISYDKEGCFAIAHCHKNSKTKFYRLPGYCIGQRQLMNYCSDNNIEYYKHNVKHIKDANIDIFEKKAIFIQSDLGTGKTELFNQALPKDKIILFLTHRITQKNSTQQRLEQKIKDQGYTILDYQNKEDLDKLDKGNVDDNTFVFCQIDSFQHIFPWQLFHYIILDESTSLQQDILNRHRTLRRLTFYTPKCSQFIFLDARQNENNIEFYKELFNIDYEDISVRQNTYVKPQEHYLMRPQPKMMYNFFQQKLKEFLIQRRQCLTIAFDSKKNLLKTIIYLRTLGIQDEEMLYFHGDMEEKVKTEQMNNIQELIKNKRVFMYTQTITCGCSVISEDFRVQFCYFNQKTISNSNDQFQMLYRSRCNETWYHFIDEENYKEYYNEFTNIQSQPLGDHQKTQRNTNLLYRMHEIASQGRRKNYIEILEEERGIKMQEIEQEQIIQATHKADIESTGASMKDLFINNIEKFKECVQIYEILNNKKIDMGNLQEEDFKNIQQEYRYYKKDKRKILKLINSQTEYGEKYRQNIKKNVLTNQINDKSINANAKRAFQTEKALLFYNELYKKSQLKEDKKSKQIIRFVTVGEQFVGTYNEMFNAKILKTTDYQIKQTLEKLEGFFDNQEYIPKINGKTARSKKLLIDPANVPEELSFVSEE